MDVALKINHRRLKRHAKNAEVDISVTSVWLIMAACPRQNATLPPRQRQTDRLLLSECIRGQVIVSLSYSQYVNEMCVLLKWFKHVRRLLHAKYKLINNTCTR